MSKLRGTKPIYRILARVLTTVLLTLLILSVVTPLPVGYRLLSIGTSYPVEANPDWLSGWDYRVKLTTDHNDIDSALSDFPVLLHISDSCGRNSDDVSFVFDELTSDDNRKKIAVTTSDGETQCYVEIEDWDDANEEAWLHVKAPSLNPIADDDFYLYYDADQVDNLQYVWDTSTGDDPYTKLQIGTSTLDAFGLLVKLGDDEIVYFFRQGTSHASDKGKIVKQTFTPSTNSWGSRSDVYVDDTYDCRNAGGGMIGTDIYLFFAKYKYTDPKSFQDIGYIKSTDGGDTWEDGDEEGDAWVSLSSQVTETAYSPYGALVATGTAGRYLQTWYEATTGTPSYKLKAFVTSDSGADEFDSSVTLYSGTDKYSEPCVTYCGSNKLIALIRDNDGGYVFQTQSEDDGDNWGSDEDYDDGVVTATNLVDSSGVKVPYIFYDSETDEVFALYNDRNDEEIKLSKVDKDTVFGSEGSWPTPTTLATSTGNSAGYPSMVKVSSGAYLYVYGKEISSSDVDTWGGYYPRRCVWDDDFLAVYHMADGADTSSIYDSTGNGYDVTKKGAAEPAVTTSGQIADAQFFDGDDYASQATLLDSIPASVSIEWIYNITGSTGTTQNIWYKFNTLEGSADRLGVYGDDDNGVSFFYEEHNNGYQTVAFTTGWTQDVASYRAVTWDTVNGILLYTAGASDGSSAGATTLPASGSARDWRFGTHYDAGSYFLKGVLDEFRVSSTQRLAPSIKATKETCWDNLLDWGSEETPEECSPSIELNTSSWSINSGNPIAESSNYATGLTYFTITNHSGGPVTITIGGSDMTGGGYTWDLADDGSPGNMIYGLYAGLSGGDYTIIVRESAPYNTLKSGLADEGTQDFGLKFYTPTNFDDGNNKSGTITLTVVCD